MNNRNDYIEEARTIITALGLPRAQQNERSALCLLALLNLKPGMSWADATNPLMGITPIMDWIRANYAKEYAPNTRETFRRQTMHQFCDAGMALYNRLPSKLSFLRNLFIPALTPTPLPLGERLFRIQALTSVSCKIVVWKEV